MVEIKKKVEIEKVVGYICDVCGISCRGDMPGEGPNEDGEGCHEWATLSATWGYFSKKDTQCSECHMCESCFDKVQGFIEQLGGKIRTWQYDMLTGHKIGDLS
jgi:hypothetical protein